ncbi:hypothetical protein E2C01_100734 [Portunus trituberculatus]|uniref:Uncharacterized protein n=1 Tax=Portunus trituberculatus TaxID=210409 RepID=A0A5B7KDS5_PORTR|nr:hypothetical protein [Portunus trituberculatus]
MTAPAAAPAACITAEHHKAAMGLVKPLCHSELSQPFQSPHPNSPPTNHQGLKNCCQQTCASPIA